MCFVLLVRCVCARARVFIISLTTRQVAWQYLYVELFLYKLYPLSNVACTGFTCARVLGFFLRICTQQRYEKHLYVYKNQLLFTCSAAAAAAGIIFFIRTISTSILPPARTVSLQLTVTNTRTYSNKTIYKRQHHDRFPPRVYTRPHTQEENIFSPILLCSPSYRSLFLSVFLSFYCLHNCNRPLQG